VVAAGRVEWFASLCPLGLASPSVHLVSSFIQFIVPEGIAMHIHEAAELAAKLALESPKLVRRAWLITDASLAEYWDASRERQSCWWKTMADWRRGLNSTQEAIDNWPAITPMLDELLVSELLTRIWSGIAAVYDHRWRESVYLPVARNTLVSQVDVRNRVWSVLLNDLQLPDDTLQALVMQRRRIERWSDLLLAHVPEPGIVAAWAVNAERMDDFRVDLKHERRVLVGSVASNLIIGSLQLATRPEARTTPKPQTANAALNARITESLASALKPAVETPEEASHRAIALRLNQQSERCEQLLVDLLSLDSAHGPARGSATLNVLE
jgi:hypothetical protein